MWETSLQKLTPIRGRKQKYKLNVKSLIDSFKFTEVNPDKGTETQ